VKIQNNELPDKIMMNVHPHRWNDALQWKGHSETLFRRMPSACFTPVKQKKILVSQGKRGKSWLGRMLRMWLKDTL
jgi:hypothetical protein